MDEQNLPHLLNCELHTNGMYPFRHFFRRFMIVTVSAPNIPDSALKVTVSALWKKKLYVNTCPNGTLNYKLVKIGNYPFRRIIKTNSTQSNRIIQIN